MNQRVEHLTRELEESKAREKSLKTSYKNLLDMIEGDEFDKDIVKKRIFSALKTHLIQNYGHICLESNNCKDASIQTDNLNFKNPDLLKGYQLNTEKLLKEHQGSLVIVDTVSKKSYSSYEKSRKKECSVRRRLTFMERLRCEDSNKENKCINSSILYSKPTQFKSRIDTSKLHLHKELCHTSIINNRRSSISQDNSQILNSYGPAYRTYSNVMDTAFKTSMMQSSGTKRQRVQVSASPPRSAPLRDGVDRRNISATKKKLISKLDEMSQGNFKKEVNRTQSRNKRHRGTSVIFLRQKAINREWRDIEKKIFKNRDEGRLI